MLHNLLPAGVLGGPRRHEQGSVALPPCTTAHPLARFANIFGASVSETAVRLDPRHELHHRDGGQCYHQFFTVRARPRRFVPQPVPFIGTHSERYGLEIRSMLDGVGCAGPPAAVTRPARFA